MTPAPADPLVLATLLPDFVPLGPQEAPRLPARPAVYVLLDAQTRPILLATTQDLRRAVASRLEAAQGAPTRRADLAVITRAVRWHTVHSAFEATWRHFRTARSVYPDAYADRIGFGPAYYLWVDWCRPIPEIAVTTAIWSGPGQWVGPWADARAAQQALEGLWDLFDLCRFPVELRRSPAGDRCAYADMGRCDAPCDTPHVVPGYVERTRRAWDFACGRRPGWADEAQGRMRRLAGERRFEQAAQVREQLSFAQRWQREWSGALADQRHRYLLALPVARRRSWTLFAFDRGALACGPTATENRLAGAARAWLGTAPVAGAAVEPRLRMEQSWLLARLLHHADARAAAIVADADLTSESAVDALLERVRTRRTVRASPG